MNDYSEFGRNIILVIDDEIGTRDDPERTAFLRAVGYYPSEGGKKRVESFPYDFEFHTGQNESGAYSIEAVKAAVLKRWPTYDGKRWALILLDVRFGDNESFGFKILRALREDPRFGFDLPIVMLTSEGDGKKDEADRLRADGFFPKADEFGNPLWNEDGLKQRVMRFGLISDDRDESLIDKTETVRLLGRSLPLLKMLREARKFGLDQGECILYGDTGCGKTELAGYIHCYTGREGPYRHWFAKKSNPEMMTTKLFGEWKGAFTGAGRSEPGEIERANKGTFFLDEVSNLPEDIQTTLLSVRKQDKQGYRTIEREGKFPTSGKDKILAVHSVVDGAQRIGSRIRVDVFLLTGTKDNLEDPDVRKKLGFRDDLHNALGNPLYCPNLNDRVEDIPTLFEAFVRRCLSRSGKKYDEFSIDSASIDLLCARDWSVRGNLRDLERIAKYSVQQLGDFRVIRPERFPPDVLKTAKSISKYVEYVASEVQPKTDDVKFLESEKCAAVPAISDRLSSLPGALAKADIAHLHLRATLLEEAAEATRKVDATTGEQTKYQPELLVSRLMGRKVKGSGPQRIIKEILQPILNPTVIMIEAYGEAELRTVREWVESRPILIKLYEYSIKKIHADKIAE